MPNRGNLSDEEYREMLEMLRNLTPAERASLADPDFITEDEADIIVAERRLNEESGTISLDELLRRTGRTRQKRIA